MTKSIVLAIVAVLAATVPAAARHWIQYSGDTSSWIDIDSVRADGNLRYFDVDISDAPGQPPPDNDNEPSHFKTNCDTGETWGEALDNNGNSRGWERVSGLAEPSGTDRQRVCQGH